MSLLNRGQAALAKRLKVSGETGGTLTYTRVVNGDAVGTVALTGKTWVGCTKYVTSDPSGGQVRVIWSDRDYLMLAADLVINGTAIEPQRGDYFTEVLPVPGGNQTYEVMPYNNEPEFRYSDPQRTTLRIHTKRVVYGG